MPEYQYECRGCSNAFSAFEKMSDDAQTKCNKCGEDSLYRVIFAPHFSIKTEPKTIGQLADQNWKKMGHYEREAKLIEDKVPQTIEKREKKQKLDKINSMTAEQKEKYIMEGD